MQLLKGNVIGQSVSEAIMRQISSLKEHGVNLKMASVLVGNDGGSLWYQKAQQKKAESLGIEFEKVNFEESIQEEQLLAEIKRLSYERKDIHGILILEPLPKHIHNQKILQVLNPVKDIDGIHPQNLGYMVMKKGLLEPSTALSSLALIQAAKGQDLRGQTAVLIGQSHVIGRPLQMMLGQRGVTTIICNSGTPPEELPRFIGQGDIVIACCGIPGLVKGEWIKEGAVVIDVGTTEVEGGLVGDVEFDTAAERASYITPVPGGVGPLTVLMLMKNLLLAYELQQKG